MRSAVEQYAKEKLAELQADVESIVIEFQPEREQVLKLIFDAPELDALSFQTACSIIKQVAQK